MVNLPGRLRALRQTRGESVATAAKTIGVASRTLTRWEAGSNTPASHRFPAIARAYGVPLDALFAEDGWIVLPTPWIRPESQGELRSPAGRERLNEAISRRIAEALEQATPLTSQAPRRRRRTREEVLEAQAERLAALRAGGVTRTRARRTIG